MLYSYQDQYAVGPVSSVCRITEKCISPATSLPLSVTYQHLNQVLQCGGWFVGKTGVDW